MCILCVQGKPQDHTGSQLGRRDFLKTAAAGGTAAGLGLFAARPAAAHDDDGPEDSGKNGRRYIIRGGAVMSMDPKVGDFPKADVLVEGKKILAVGPNLSAGGAAEIDARGKVVMPGFIDTHHHQAWTPIRSSIPDSILINDFSGTASAEQNYAINVLGFGAAPALPGFAEHYRPDDVYIGELFGGLSQLDAGVTTVHDISQIHHSKEHSLAAIQALRDTGRRAKFGFFESAGGVDGGSWYPSGANFLRNNVLSSDDSLVTMVMGGEVYLGNATTRQSWTIGRNLGLQVAAHILSPFGIRPILDQLAGVSPDVADGTGADLSGIEIGADNLFVHMTGMSDAAWEKVALAGAKVSIAFPIEMNMRHGQPPILKMQELKAKFGIDFEPSLSVDVETNMTADFFTQMRSAMTMQRLVVNQKILELGTFSPPFTSQWPLAPYPADIPPLLNARDVLRFATINGAKHLRLDGKTGSLTPGKEADIIILDGTHLNVFPINNVPGAVVTLMERTNVETVIVAGKVRKWKGKLLDVDLGRMRRELENTRDFLYTAVGRTQNLFP
ncbi:MAG TPA: amidohydrolase family protein [Burkholderiales bacterium]|nr:amidohydrolase family protein [Burkholderiales bacterium]